MSSSLSLVSQSTSFAFAYCCWCRCRCRWLCGRPCPHRASLLGANENKNNNWTVAQTLWTALFCTQNGMHAWLWCFGCSIWTKKKKTNKNRQTKITEKNCVVVFIIILDPNIRLTFWFCFPFRSFRSFFLFSSQFLVVFCILHWIYILKVQRFLLANLHRYKDLITLLLVCYIF